MANEVVNIGPPADVDPAGRFVEQQQSDILFLKAASKEDFLLVAAAECFRRSAEPLAVEPDQPGETLGERGGKASIDNAAAAHCLQASRQKVASNGLVQKQTPPRPGSTAAARRGAWGGRRSIRDPVRPASDPQAPAGPRWRPSPLGPRWRRSRRRSRAVQNL